MENGLSLIIPAYNEEQSIIKTFDELNKYLFTSSEKVEVIIVNDGSTDNTKDLILNNISISNNIIIINNETNQGYGASLKTGLNKAKYEYIGITDADSTYPNNRIIEFFKESKKDNLDMLIGERENQYINFESILRKFAKWFLRLLASYLTETKINDLNSGFRIMKKSVVEKFIKILPDGFSFTSTITIAMLSNNYKVRYKKIDYLKRAGKSKIRPIYNTVNFFILILRSIMYFKPLKIFLPLSLIFLLLGLSLIIYRIFIGEGFLVISSVLLIGSLQMLGLGLLADLINKK